MSYLSNKEQADLVKAFWRDYGRWIAIAIVVGLLVGFGWRHYQQSRQQRQLAASVLYNDWLQSSVGSGGKSTPDAVLIKQFQSDFSSSVYRSLLELQVAADLMKQEKWGEAEAQLRGIVARNAHPSLTDLARIRLARVLIAEKKSAAALTVLAQTKTESQLMKMLVSIELSRAYQLQGKQAEAHQAAADAHALAKIKGIELHSYLFA